VSEQRDPCQYLRDDIESIKQEIERNQDALSQPDLPPADYEEIRNYLKDLGQRLAQVQKELNDCLATRLRPTGSGL
jgi:uncharacterized coiled-coil DUF342 family protein